jgi:hypothetical protein
MGGKQKGRYIATGPEKNSTIYFFHSDGNDKAREGKYWADFQENIGRINCMVYMGHNIIRGDI